MNKWVMVEFPFDFVRGEHEPSTLSFGALDAEDLVMNPVGKIEGSVVLLEKLEPAVNW